MFVLIVVDHVGKSPPANIGVDPGFERIETSHTLMECDGGAGQDPPDQVVELLAGSETERRHESAGSLVREQIFQELDHGEIARALVDAGPRGDSDGPTGSGHSGHFGEAGDWVSEEHQSELADHSVEGVVGEGQALGWTVEPGDRFGAATGDAQHPLVDVDTGDRTRAAKPASRFTSKDSGTAADIEDIISSRESRRVEHPFRPLVEQGRYKDCLLYTSDAADDSVYV